METKNGTGTANNGTNKTDNTPILDLDKIIALDTQANNGSNKGDASTGNGTNGSSNSSDGNSNEGNNGGNNGTGEGANSGNNGGGNEGQNNPLPKVIVDEITYTLDENGNALNDVKEIIYTKDQLEAFAQGTGSGGNDDPNKGGDELTIVGSIQKRFGYEFKGQDGNPKQYEDTEDGLEAYVEDLVQHKVKESQAQFLGSIPKVELYYRHLASGGSDETFFNVIKDDWKIIKFDDKSPQQHVDIITKALIKKGFDVGIASQTAAMYNEQGKAGEYAKRFLDDLVANQTKDEEAIRNEYARKLQDSKKEWESYVTNVSTFVQKKGQIGSFVIPEAERKTFMEYMFVKNAEGKTQEEVDIDNDPLEIDLQLKYLRFKQFKLQDIINRQATTQRLNTLRDKFSKGGEINRLKSGSNGQPPKQKVNTSVDKVVGLEGIE
jgi:hypothetical protein